MIREFVETSIYERLIDIEKDKDLERFIKDEILKDPKTGDVMSSTGGARKIRISRKEGKGKRSGLRVIYLDLPKAELTYLSLFYKKGVKDDLNSEEKKALKALVEEIKNEHKEK